MALVKLLKVSNGVPRQHNSAADEIAMLTGQFGNVKMAGNTITSEDTDGAINLLPNGTGVVNFYGAYDFPVASGSLGQHLEFDGSGNLIAATPSVGQVSNSYTADEALAAFDAVYISAADNVSKADANAMGTSQVVGITAASATDTNPVDVISEGVITGMSGLTAGARYFLSETAGLMTTTPPSSDEVTIVQLGYAKSATEFHVHIEIIAEIDTD